MHGTASNHAIEDVIARHIEATDWISLPVVVRSHAARAVTWALGTNLEGMREPGQEALLRYVGIQAGRREATVLGTGIRTTAELAGLVNGRATKAWEHEDKYWVDETIGFGIACCVIPAALAASELRGSISGRELATAVALGIDLEARIMRPLGLGFVLGRAAANATFVLGTYGAAAAAAKILGLDAPRILDTLGIAHCQASGNFQGQAEGRGVSLQSGIAVRNGISAARLAHEGMPGPRAWLSGVVGLYRVHYPESTVDPADVVNGLGEEFLNVKLGYKAHACGVVAHPVIDAVLAARPQMEGRTVMAVDVFGPRSLGIMADPIDGKRAPKTATEAQFSIPWAAACALRDGVFSIDHLDASALHDPALLSLAGRVSVHMSDGARGNSVRLTFFDGSVLQPPTVFAPKGHPDNPLSGTEIESVLLRAAEKLSLPTSSTREALDRLRCLDDEDNVADIVQLLSAPAGGQKWMNDRASQ